MKKALVGAALLLAPFFSFSQATDFREGNQSLALPPNTVESCKPNETEQQWLSSLPKGSDQSDGTTRYSNYTLKESEVLIFDSENNFCQMRFNAERTLERYSPSVGWYTPGSGGTQSTSKNVNGTLEQAETCINHPEDQGQPYNEQHSQFYRDSNGTGMCFSIQDLADIDTCDANGPFLPTTDTTSPQQCFEKEDGSLCRYDLRDADGQKYLQPTAEPSHCYGTGLPRVPNTNNSEPPPNEGECTISNGLSVCAENPANVCDSYGNCQSGCGTIAFGGVEQFVCLSTDTDGDGIYDYQDRDIDGDGILNENDLDADGDGIEDPVNGNQSTIRSPHQSSVESLLAQIEQNTRSNNGGGSGTGATASEIGEEVAEQIEDKLVELGDFDTSSYEQRVDEKTDSAFTAIDEFLENDEKNLTNAFDQSEYENSFTGLKNALSPKGCSANFEIPLTSQSLDLCESASKAQPFLYVIFAISTFIYCVRRIQSTARKE